MSESLDRILEDEFKGIPDAELVRVIQSAEPFGSDDEEYELNRRLTLVGMAWRFSQKYGENRVIIYTPGGGEE